MISHQIHDLTKTSRRRTAARRHRHDARHRPSGVHHHAIDAAPATPTTTGTTPTRRRWPKRSSVSSTSTSYDTKLTGRAEKNKEVYYADQLNLEDFTLEQGKTRDEITAAELTRTACSPKPRTASSSCSPKPRPGNNGGTITSDRRTGGSEDLSGQGQDAELADHDICGSNGHTAHRPGQQEPRST